MTSRSISSSIASSLAIALVLLAGCATTGPSGTTTTTTDDPPPIDATALHFFRVEGMGRIEFQLSHFDLLGCDPSDELEMRRYSADGSVHDWRMARPSTLGTLKVDVPDQGPHIVVTKCIFGSVSAQTNQVTVEGLEDLVQSEIPDDEWTYAFHEFTWPDDTLRWEAYPGGFQTTWHVPLNYLGGYCCLLRPPFQGSIELLRPDGSRYAFIDSVNGEWIAQEGYPGAPYPPEVTVRVSTVCCGANWTIRTVVWDDADFQAFGMQPPDRAKYATDLKVEYVPRP